jgi:RNA recognition motif-containing protein
MYTISLNASKIIVKTKNGEQVILNPTEIIVTPNKISTVISSASEKQNPSSDDFCTVIIENLPRDTAIGEVINLVEKYGNYKSIYSDFGYWTVIFEDSRDAVDCIGGLNGYKFCGKIIKVKHLLGI